jgi:hypothetical protein
MSFLSEMSGLPSVPGAAFAEFFEELQNPHYWIGRSFPDSLGFKRMTEDTLI